MARLSKEEIARYGGANWILGIVREKGLEEAEKEMKMRGAAQVPLNVKRSDLRKFEDMTKLNTISTLSILADQTLKDEFNFSDEDLSRFNDRFNQKADCLSRDFIDWKSVQQSLYEETGIMIPLEEVLPSNQIMPADNNKH